MNVENRQSNTKQTVTVRDGFAFLFAGELGKAEKVFAAFARAQPNNHRAWHGLGLVATRRENISAAKETLERALRLAPDNERIALDYVNILRRLGDFETALKHIDRCLSNNPRSASAYMYKVSMQKYASDTDLLRIEALIAQGGHDDADKHMLHFAAGKICDDLKDVDRAFAHFEIGNRLRNVSYDHAAECARFEQAKRVFTPDFIERHRRQSSLGADQIFIVGMPRSGTTLLEEVLSRHPLMYGVGERGDIHGIIRALPSHDETGRDYPDCIAGLDADVFRGFGQAYLDVMRSIAPGCEYTINKHPLNFPNIGLIKILLPKAKIIHSRRNPLDNLLSCYIQNFRIGHEYSYELNTLGQFYNLYCEMIGYWKMVFPGEIIDVHYDDLVADRESTLRDVIRFIGLEWDDNCLSDAATDRVIATASHWQARQKIHRDSVNKSDRYRHHLAPLETVIAEEMEAYRLERAKMQSAVDEPDYGGLPAMLH